MQNSVETIVEYWRDMNEAYSKINETTGLRCNKELAVFDSLCGMTDGFSFLHERTNLLHVYITYTH
jgi:hypothetical protein